MPGRATEIQFGFDEEETSECVTACTESARRLCTPFLRISLAMWAFTVRSSMPSAAPISLFDRPPTSNSKTSFSRAVKTVRPAGKKRPGDWLAQVIKAGILHEGEDPDFA